MDRVLCLQTFAIVFISYITTGIAEENLDCGGGGGSRAF